MTAILFGPNIGVAGSVSRKGASHMQSYPVDSTKPLTSYGRAVKSQSSDGSVIPIEDGDAISTVIGFLVRPFPASGAPLQNAGFDVQTPNPIMMQDVLRRGYMTVVLKGVARPSPRDPVYIRTSLPTATSALGDVEAAAGAGLEPLPSAVFSGFADQKGNVEIEYNI